MASGQRHHGGGLRGLRGAVAAVLLSGGPASALLAAGPAAAQSAPAGEGTGPEAPPAATVGPGSRPVLQARPLSVKSTGAGQSPQGATSASAPSASAASPSSSAPSAAPPTAAPGAGAALRLSEAPPDRLSPLCRTAALKLLQQRRRGTPLSAADQQEQDDFRDRHLDCFNATGAGLTSGAAGVGEELLRSVAQVVLKRAQTAAWRLLQEKLLAAAGCDAGEGAVAPGATAGPGTAAPGATAGPGTAAPGSTTGPGTTAGPRFPATCAALRSLSIADLASSPAVLLDAVIADFLPMASPGEKTLWMRVPILEEALRESAARWRQAGASGVQSGLAQIVRRRMKEQVQKADCELATSAPDKALWVSGMCLIEAQAPANFSKCDVDGWASQCTDPITTERILRLWSLAARLFGAQGKVPLADYADFVCTSAEIAIDEAPGLPDRRRREAHDYVSAVRAVLGGLGRKDWIETTSGAVRVLRLVVTSAACDGAAESAACKDSRAAETLFTLLAAVGNYAESFSAGGKDAGAVREKILEDLADRMVNRAYRDSGWVVSAGGNLGLYGGARTDFGGGLQVAFPVQLGLGVGLQSYGRGEHGFHAMATAFDLGQYITFSSSSLEVSAPAIESSVVLGLTAGAWVALRETPLYIGAYGGVSPFVKANERPTFQLGLSTGIYVPLLDFN